MVQAAFLCQIAWVASASCTIAEVVASAREDGREALGAMLAASQVCKTTHMQDEKDVSAL